MVRKFVKFEINENAEIGALNKHSSQTPDPRNGEGEFLGTVRLGDKIVMFTRTVKSPNHNYEGFIRANEVAFDSYSNGDVMFYYNPEPSEDLIRLQQLLEQVDVEAELEKGATIGDILEMVGCKTRKGIDRIVEKEFMPTTRKERKVDLDDEVLVEVPAKEIYVTGLMPEVFESLKQGMSYLDDRGISFYSLLCEYQQEKEVTK